MKDTEVASTDWQPSATLETLKMRADLLGKIRSFFAAAGVMEVETPLLGRAGVTDLHIECIEAQVCAHTRYLQSSPEYFMKRLLAAGSGPIYSLGKVFRDGEEGSRHRPEFTMLEWYRPGWDEVRLMLEIEALFLTLAQAPLLASRFSYGDIFESVLGFNPHTTELTVLQQAAAKKFGGQWRAEGRSTLLELLFSMEVEPQLPAGLVFIHHYPACQAALARLVKDDAGVTTARRFEVFLNGMELGNGYFELTDAVEQRTRFQADLALRAAAGSKPMPIDEGLLAALEAGLPDCAGVAIGVDRLLMQLLGVGDIGEVVAFN